MTTLLGEEIFDRTIAKPFEPFRIRFQDGSAVDVTNGEYVGCGVSFSDVCNRQQPGEPRSWQRFPLADVGA